MAEVAWPALGARRPCLIGIVNITQDSFSDGGLYLQPDAAVARAYQLASSGADIIELGPSASHPGSIVVSDEDERRRLEPVVERLSSDGFRLSIDSYRQSTHRLAIGWNAAFINDVYGFPDAQFYGELAASDCFMVVVHRVRPPGGDNAGELAPESVWEDLITFFESRLPALMSAGISESRIIIDPGMGFMLSTDPEPSLMILSRIGELRQRFGLPVLVSPSRKSFLRAITGRGIDEIGSATLAAELYSAIQGADYIRSHDIDAICDAFTIFESISRITP